MKFIEIVFRIGVILAIFSFIWGLIKIGFTIVRGGLPLSYPASLALKALQFFIIVAVTILFCTDNAGDSTYNTLVTGLILLMYFVGKIQNTRIISMMVQIQGKTFGDNARPKMGLEIGLVVLNMAVFTFFVLEPQFAENSVSRWFYTTITDIEKTPIFGFIFKIIGFFFTLAILMRMMNAIGFILSGKAFEKKKSRNNDQHFDDFEELN